MLYFSTNQSDIITHSFLTLVSLWSFLYLCDIDFMWQNEILEWRSWQNDLSSRSAFQISPISQSLTWLSWNCRCSNLAWFWALIKADLKLSFRKLSGPWVEIVLSDQEGTVKLKIKGPLKMHQMDPYTETSNTITWTTKHLLCLKYHPSNCSHCH